MSSGGSSAPRLEDDLLSVGIDVLGSTDVERLVQEVVRREPDLVICYETYPNDAFFAGTTTLRAIAPRPVVVFTTDPDAEKIERATRSGIHAYVVNGYGRQRLRSVFHVAQARFRQEQLLLNELSDVRHRFDERKLVDRAKGILMRVRNIAEDDAYRVLRSAAMQSKQRIGQISQQVIDAARYAEAVNRAGQLRMLSQRLVKLYALMCADVTPDETIAQCRSALEQVEANMGILSRALSKATFGDLLDGVSAPWTLLKSALAAKPALARIGEIDRLAERLLSQAEALTKTLETAGFASALHIINVSGRQRMLSQRLAKQAIIGALSHGATSDADRRAAEATEKAFVEGLAYLHGIPLTTPDIKAQLATATEAWMTFKSALGEANTPASKEQIARSSEVLLESFGQLTDLYERAMHLLLGEAKATSSAKV